MVPSKRSSKWVLVDRCVLCMSGIDAKHRPKLDAGLGAEEPKLSVYRQQPWQVRSWVKHSSVAVCV